MKKLLLLIIVLACMGCDDAIVSPLEDLSGEEGLIPACEQSSSCDWPMKFDESSCTCSWSLFGG